MPRQENLKGIRRRRRLRFDCALEDRAITTKTRQRYYNALQRLRKDIDTSHTLDEEVAHWVYEEGESITLISDALCGLQHYCNGLKGQLGPGIPGDGSKCGVEWNALAKLHLSQ